MEAKSKKINTKEELQEICQDLVKNCKEVTHVSMKGNSYSTEACSALAEILQDCPKLKAADFSDMFVGRLITELPIGLKQLMLSLNETQIEELDLSHNAFGPAGVEAFAFFLEKAVNMKRLFITNNGLGPEGSEHLGNVLLTSPINLDAIEIGRNRLEDKGSASVGKALERMASLKRVSIPQNGIREKGMSSLLVSLCKCTHLEDLDLNDNYIAGAAAPELIKLFSNAKEMKILNVSDTMLGKETTFELFKIIKKMNTPIKEIYCNYNEVESKINDCLKLALEFPSLKKLVFTGNDMSKKQRSTFSKLFEEKGIEFTFMDEDEEEEEDDDEEEEENDEEEEDQESEKQPETNDSEPKNASVEDLEKKLEDMKLK